MKKEILAEIGISEEVLTEKVVDRIVGSLLFHGSCDDEGYEHQVRSDFSRKLGKRIEKGIDEAVDRLAEKHVLPNVTEYIESLCLQETNQWGEKTGKASMTFIEYLVERAENYMVEKVNYEGKSKSEAGGYSWSPSQTRITHLVHKHLHYSIEQAMKEALKSLNNQVAKGLADTVKLKLEEFTEKLKVTVAVK